MTILDQVSSLYAHGFIGTADEAAMQLSLNILAVRPRVSELFKEGRLFSTGKTRLNASGKRALVWAAKH
jgi:hypothetical protein